MKQPTSHLLALRKVTPKRNERSRTGTAPVRLLKRIMAYRLKADQSIPDGFRRVVWEEIDSAVEFLRKAQISQRDKAVHEARKSIKKIRGVLRLIQPQLGSTYKRENRRFRDIGRKLSELRDAAALLEIFDQLAEKFKDVVDAKQLRTIRGGIEKDKAETEKRLDATNVVREAMSTLHSAKDELAKWSLEENGFKALAPGLENTYRRGRKALKLAQKKGTSVAYHEFRKWVKDRWYHVRLLEGVWTDVMKAHEKSLKDLETLLGDDHNLAVLRDKLRRNPARYGGAANVDAFLTIAAQHGKELRENAVALGERIYSEKPAVVVRRAEKLWKVWHIHGESGSDVARPPRPVAAKPVRQSASSAVRKAG